MVTHVKTTVDIADALLDEAKRVAARRHTTLRALIEDGLRQIVKERKEPHEFRLKDASFRGEGLQPGVEEGSWERLRDLIYEGRGS